MWPWNAIEGLEKRRFTKACFDGRRMRAAASFPAGLAPEQLHNTINIDLRSKPIRLFRNAKGCSSRSSDIATICKKLIENFPCGLDSERNSSADECKQICCRALRRRVPNVGRGGGGGGVRRQSERR